MKHQALAKMHGGVMTWSFSQGGMETFFHMVTNAKSRFGVCAALSAYWIREHAYGKSLAETMRGGKLPSVHGPRNEVKMTSHKINTDMFKEIRDLHIEASQGNMQEQKLTRWLAKYHINRTTSNFVRFKGNDSKTGHRLIRGGKSEQRFVNSSNSNIANFLDDFMTNGIKKITNSYAYLSFGGTAMMMDAGHATDAWIGTDATFFDPNSGEYWFPNRSSFYNFFAAYYEQEYITKTADYRKSWGVVGYAANVLKLKESDTAIPQTSRSRGIARVGV